MKKIGSLLTILFLLVLTGAPAAAAGHPAPLTKPKVPESAGTYAEKQKIREENPLDEAFLQALTQFTGKTSCAVFNGKSGNTMYSPASLYMALAVAATGAKGQTQSEMLDLLAIENRSDGYLSEQSGNLFRRLYVDSESSKLKIANSLWAKNAGSLKKEFLNNAQDSFFASIYNVDFSKSETSKAISQWIADNTGGTLAPDLTLSPSTVLAIINTVYLKDEWSDQFHESLTKDAPFTLADGSTVECPFMNQTFEPHSYWKGDGFTKTSLPLKQTGQVHFILPDPGVSVQDLLSSPEKVEALFQTENPVRAKVIASVPKFTFDSSFELSPILQSLGMQTVFSDSADFSGITQGGGLSISDVRQETHVAADEKGVEAAAYTMITMVESAMMLGELPVLEFKLDRPFLFAITADENVPLFIGTVTNPANQK